MSMEVDTSLDGLVEIDGLVVDGQCFQSVPLYSVLLKWLDCREECVGVVLEQV